ncbi:MAG TPA: aminotransferase class V-fold PLP-dependent enzyme, partial [Roseiarcus sp.]
MASPRRERAYLDYNATAPLRAEARTAIAAAFDLAGNPSSIHAEGRAARATIEEARRAVAELAGVAPRGIVFTSGGTEAANLALTPIGKAVRLIAGAGEHSCVLAGHRFPPEAATLAPLGADGRIDLAALQAALDSDGPAMLALQGANNETGVVQPVAEAAALVHTRGGIVICDAVQLAGRTSLDEATLGADFIILSAHKFGGPKGVGALIPTRPELNIGSPMLRGGGQERGARAGTENVAGISGFGAAARTARAEVEGEAARLAGLRDRLEARILGAAPDAVVFWAGAPRLPNTTCFAVPGIAAAMLLMRLDLAGVAASSGSACSS